MSQREIRVLGVDPGLTRCGVGVIEGAPGSQLRLINVGVILTPSTTALELRLLQLERELTQWVEDNRPDVVAVERVFSQHNVRTVMGTGQAAGIALLVAARAGIPVVMHTPSEVKAAVTGYGRADKAQITSMVTRLLNLPEPPKPADAADALALALCHAWKGHGKSRIAEHLAKQEAMSAR